MEHGGYLKSHRGLDYSRARRELISSFVHSIQHWNFSSLFFPLIIYLWCLKKSEMSDNDETRSHNVRRAIELESCLVGDDDEMKNLLYWRAREHTQQTRGVFVHKFISTLKVSFFSFVFFSFSGRNSSQTLWSSLILLLLRVFIWAGVLVVFYNNFLTHPHSLAHIIPHPFSLFHCLHARRITSDMLEISFDARFSLLQFQSAMMHHKWNLVNARGEEGNMEV